LGIITAATLKLFDAPAAQLTAWASVPSLTAAVDLLVTQYQQNERGIPEAPKIVMTEGVWRAAQD
jgi:FAD/FMN-containing dehydrogenase